MTKQGQPPAPDSSGKIASFTPARDQDAWGTIRGFVYQVNLTIERWLTLPADVVLELEHGEDIDHILAAAGEETERTGPHDPQRLLEQMKHLEANITLRHSSVIKAICDFLAHRAANPELYLRFRYTTNAAAGIERPAAIAGAPKVGAIQLWHALHTQTVLPVGITESLALDGIRSILLSAKHPEAVKDDKDWKRFQDILTDKGDVATLVNGFEWGLNQTEHTDLAGQLQKRLQALGHASNANDAKQQHERLFLSVFNTLSRPGLKRLQASDLGLALATEPSSERDTKLLRLLVGWFGELKLTVQEHAHRLDTIEKSFRELAEASNATIELRHVVAIPETQPPPPLDRGCKRSKTVDSIAGALASGAWLAMNGPIASGKSELALLLAECFGSHLWIPFRGLEERDACVRIDAVFNSILNLAPNESWLLLSEPATSSALDGYKSIVLDDILALTEGDLSRRVLRLAKTCGASHTRLITTSNRTVAPAVRARASDAFFEITAPAFSAEDTRELLSLYGMPKDWPNKRVEYICAHASGNPAILTSVAVYLESAGWDDDAKWFDGLVAGDFGHELNDDTIERLIETVADAETKELLFRLREAIGNVDNEQIALVAAIPEPVPAPLERLAALTGLWLQRTGKGAFAVSPLIKRLKPSNLSPKTRRETNAALARHILGRKTIDQIQGSIALAHLVAAEEWDRAGVVLAQAHLQAAQAGIKKSEIPLLQSWASMPLPDQMRPALRLFIRALQFGRDDRTQKQAALYLSDIRSLLGKIEDGDAWAVAAVAVYGGTELPERDLALALEIQVRAAKYPAGAIIAKPDEPELAVGLESMIWFSVGAIRTFEDINVFFDGIKSIPTAKLIRAGIGDAAARGQQIIARRLWLAECERDENDRNWPVVLEGLDAIREKAVALKLVWLRVCVDATRMIVHAEHLKDVDAAAAVAEHSLQAKDLDDDQLFMLEECIGRQFLYAGDHANAQKHIARALTRCGRLFPEDRVVAAMCLSKAIANDDVEAALEPAQRAVEFGEQLVGMPGLWHVKALGELAIAEYYHGGTRAAFDTLERAVQELFRQFSAENEWKVLLRGLMQVVLNLQLEASGVTLPIDPSVATPISRGLMLAHGSTQLLALHSDSVEHGLLLATSMLAEDLGFDERACDWAYRALQPPRGEPNVFTLTVCMPRALPGLLAKRCYGEALDAAATACSGFVAARILEEAGRGAELVTVIARDVIEEAGQVGSERLSSVMLEMFLIPCSAALARLSLDDSGRAVDDALEVAGLCRQLAVRESSSAWESAAALMESFASGASAKVLFDFASAADNFVVKASGYLLASTLGSISTGDAWGLQDQALKFIDEHWRKGSPLIYRLIVVPFFEAYWRDKVERQRFQFTPPGPTADRFVEAMASDQYHRARSILNAVGFGLGKA